MGSTKARNFGRYEILAEVGCGAMGVVYQARDPKIDRLVAIKTILLANQDPAHESEFRERFFLEARAAGRLSHPGIVTIFDVGEDAETRAPYIVMEYVAGETLEKFLARTPKVSFAIAMQLAHELAEALDYAHTQQVVHRDIKPANIMITEDGRAKIADFGIAKLNLSNLTLAGDTIGTPAYMAPEQLEGESVDGRADLFSIGVILYAMLTGHRPFQGTSAVTVSFKVVHKDPVPPTAFDPDLPPDLDVVIARAMAKVPSQRYQTGREMAQDIEDLLQGYIPRSIARSPHHRTSASSPAFALQAIHDAVPPALARAAKTKTIRHSARPSILQMLRHPLAWEVIASLAACLLLGLVLLRSIPHHAAGTGRVVASTSIPNTKLQSAPTNAAVTAPDALPSTASNHEIAHTSDIAPIEEHPAVEGTSDLNITINHHFTQARFSIWVDHRLAYRHELEGEVRKHMILFHDIDGSESASLRLPPGRHEIKVEVTSRNGYDQVRTLSADLPPRTTRLLQVKCSGTEEMSLRLK
jgi:eukaryotic-like serine/threonine-protein kinase